MVQIGGDQLTVYLKEVTKLDSNLACVAPKPGLLTNYFR